MASFPRRHPRLALGLAFGLLALLAGWMLGTAALDRAAEERRQALAADAAAQAGRIGEWLAGQRAGLASLAENPALQIYFTRLQEVSAEEALPEQEYLRNLLTSASARLGLQDRANPMAVSGAMRADGGIALLDLDGNAIATSLGMPSASPQHLELTAPVHALQAEPSAETQVASLVSVVPLDRAPLLQPASGGSDFCIAAQRAQQCLVPDDAGLVGEDRLASTAPVAGTALALVASTDRSTALADATRWRSTLLLAALFAAVAAAALGHIGDMLGNRRQVVMLRSMNGIITLLGALADQRDPHCKRHSETVAAIARAVAEDMGLDAHMQETTELAAKLMNVGKAQIPSEMLTRTDRLEAGELSTIRSSMLESADLLRGLDFDGPITETLEQSQEWMNGSGPRRLSGERILVSARIVAAANTFVAMISPRAYRAPLPVEKALDILSQSTDRFDMRVVDALRRHVESSGAFAAGRASVNG